MFIIEGGPFAIVSVIDDKFHSYTLQYSQQLNLYGIDFFIKYVFIDSFYYWFYLKGFEESFQVILMI